MDDSRRSSAHAGRLALVNDVAEQLALARAAVRPTNAPAATDEAREHPVASVLLGVGLPHLDRPFDYLVPARHDQGAVPGSRVKVRFAGRDVDGFVLERVDRSEHEGPLTPIKRSVSAEPVLTPEVAGVVRAVADRYAGTAADVVRLAVPPRHARVEAAARPAPVETRAGVHVSADSWSRMRGGEAFLRRLRAGDHPRAAWCPLGTDDWAATMAVAAVATVESGRGALLLAPDRRDVDRLSAAVGDALGPGRHVVLTADLGPAARYRAFLACLRGDVPVVVGTRAAAFAPVQSLGLVAMWDDGDDLYAEQRAPYPHAREVLRIRAQLQRTALAFGGYARSVETAALVASGWVHPVSPARDSQRAAAPRTHVTGESEHDLEHDPAARTARVPRRVFEVVRSALADGPVLVHTPRQGYLPAIVCADCGQRARCPTCQGPLARRGQGHAPECRWCGSEARSWGCPNCQGSRINAPVVGAGRTTEEWGRSFPSTTVISSTGEHVVDRVGPAPAIVIATPGAEPFADGGYAAAVLLDTWLTLSRPSLRAGEEALRRWFNIAALVRPKERNGRMIAVGDAASTVLQGLVRADPLGVAERELADRQQAHLPPADLAATLTATSATLDEALGQLRLPDHARVLGPVPVGDDDVRLVVSLPNREGPLLTRRLKDLQALRSAKKLPPVRIHVDPPDL